MSKFRVTAAAVILPVLLASCQSSSTAVSSFAGANLVGDRSNIVIAREVDRERFSQTTSRTTRKRPAKPADTSPLTIGDRGEGSILRAFFAPRQEVVARSKGKARKASKSRGFVQRGVFSSTDRGANGIILASLPKNEASNIRRKNAATGHKKKVSKKLRRRAKVSKRRNSTGSRARYRSLIAKHARANGVPLKLALAVVEVESNFRSGARGRAGEIGLMQIMPRTARGIGYRGKMKHLYKPNTNLKYGMKYLGKAYRLGGRKTCGAILKYNAGHGAKRMNPISRKYCARVARIMRRRT